MRRRWLILFSLAYFLIGLGLAANFIERQDMTLYSGKTQYRFQEEKIKAVDLNKKLDLYQMQVDLQSLKPQADKAMVQVRAGVAKLRQIGWSDSVIYYAYLQPLEKEWDAKKRDQEIKTMNLEKEKLASPTYNRLLDKEIALMRQEKSKNLEFSSQQKRASHLLKIALKTISMPSNLSGSQTETSQLLGHFDEDLEPDSPYWRQLALWVQYTFPKGLSKKKAFYRQVHQLRYVISAQQADYIRRHHKRKGWTDAQALADYVSDLDESNTFLEEIGVDNSDYYYDYSSDESARLHNKIPLRDLEGEPEADQNQPMDQSLHIQFKLVMHFHTEFILDENGHFVNELDKEGKSENGIANGASFNYAQANSDSHQILDIKPAQKLDPSFRKKVIKTYKIPNTLRDEGSETAKRKWIDSYFNENGYFAFKGKSRYQVVKDQVDAFKELVQQSSQKRKTKESLKWKLPETFHLRLARWA